MVGVGWVPLSPSPVRSKRLALDEPERPLAAMPFGLLCQPQGVALTWTSTRSERDGRLPTRNPEEPSFFTDPFSNGIFLCHF